jgi:hypothetical protein
MDANKLAALIRKCLARFYERRIAALESLNLDKVLKRKNPYLFRANSITNAPEMITELLAAHISSSDEGIFGEEFFEPICKLVAQVQTGAAKGIDFIIETEDSYQAISLKSGPNAFNSSQVDKQTEQFRAIERSLRATLKSLRKQFIPIMGCGYGRVDSPPTKSRGYYKLAGQAFWERVTGDQDFYLKLVRLMRDDPDGHRPVFKDAWDRAVNRFVKQFSERFCDSHGNILWEKLVVFNSARVNTSKGKSKREASS